MNITLGLDLLDYLNKKYDQKSQIYNKNLIKILSDILLHLDSTLP